MKKDPRMNPSPRPKASGFTLLELVVVVAILVILAGILLPKFDLFKLKANKGVAASNMTDVSRIIQTYYAQNAVYPDRWDSLMVSATNLWDTANASTDGDQLEPQLVGGPPAAASPHKLKVGTALVAGEARSLARIGITTIIDVDAAATGAPNDRFDAVSAARTIDTGTVLAELDLTDDDAKAIVNHIYPRQADPANPVFPTGKKLVVFGFGQQNTAVGNLVQEVPFYPNTDVTKYYSRFLAIFEVDNGGARADLMAVVGADGDQIGDEVGDYYQRAN